MEETGAYCCTAVTVMQVSVIIPTYARPEILRLVLEGLCKQTEPAHLAEVFVVCDGFDEATKSVAQGFAGRLPLRYLEQPKQGVSFVRNLGIASAAAPIVLLLDDDVIPGPELIAEHARFHREMVDEHAVLLGYVTWHPDVACNPFMRWYGEYGALFGYGLLRDDAQANVRFFYSCNVSLKRSFLGKYGTFNESLTVMEDYELGFRLKRGGMQLSHRKAAVGFHYQTFTFERSCRRLESYSSGLNAFLQTDAGRAVANRRNSPLFRSAEIMVRMTAPLLGFLLPIVDSRVRLPRAIYRLLYWYHGSYRSFWSRADQHLLARRDGE
jgi:glycosyltransferase involved in cell wall biosynthesis